MAARTVGGSASRPPRWCGRQRRKNPASRSAAAVAVRQPALALAFLDRRPERGAELARRGDEVTCRVRRGLLSVPGSTMHGGGRHSPVVGSMTDMTSLTALTGTPTQAECSRIAASSSATYTQ